jgi:hypothetical protein
LWQSEKQLNESCEPYVSPFENQTVLSGCIKQGANKSEIDEPFLRSTIDTFVLNRAQYGSLLRPSLTEISRKWLHFVKFLRFCHIALLGLRMRIGEQAFVNCIHFSTKREILITLFFYALVLCSLRSQSARTGMTRIWLHLNIAYILIFAMQFNSTTNELDFEKLATFQGKIPLKWTDLNYCKNAIKGAFQVN